MHTVGHIADVAFLPVVTLPDAGEHLLGDLTVQPAHTVCLLACVEGEDAHRETLVGVGVLTAHVHKVVPGDTELGGEATHVFAEKAFVEIVVAGGHRSVYGIEA